MAKKKRIDSKRFGHYCGWLAEDLYLCVQSGYWPDAERIARMLASVLGNHAPPVRGDKPASASRCVNNAQCTVQKLLADLGVEQLEPAQQ
jgi:hypothetical protein